MFYISDWKNNFFSSVYSFAQERMQENIHKALFVFPTNRSKQIYLEYCKEQINTAFLPEILTIEEWLNSCKLFWAEQKEIEVRQLDRLESIRLLFDIVSQLALEEEENFYTTILSLPLENKKSDSSYKALENFQYFYSYGIFLDKIIQECFEENNIGLSLSYSSDKVDDFSAYLLRNLRAITLKYKDYLTKNRCATKAYQKFCLAQKLSDLTNPPSRIYRDKVIFFCGIDSLTKSEEICMRHFLDQEAYFLFSSDPLLANNPQKAHWSTAFYKDLAQRWELGFKLLEDTENIQKKNYFFHQAFDLHSQFQDLTLQPDDKNTACVLANEESLIPLLYTLYKDFADKELNVTMGYSLKTTSLVQFFYTLDRLKQNIRFASAEGNRDRYIIQYNDIIDFISFPYFMIPLKESEKKIREQETPYIELAEIFEENSPLLLFIEDILKLWLSIESLADLVRFIETLKSVIFVQATEDIERIALIRLEKICQYWKDKEYINERLGYELCLKILLEYIENESVPFSYHSDSAVQVMGLLETKSLSFDTVHIFDVNDDFLPRKIVENPLLPESLRPYLGLKTSQEKEKYSAHIWYHLLASTKTVHAYWQETSAKGLYENKKSRSPYLEDLLWLKEQEKQSLIGSESEELTQASCPIELSQHEIAVEVKGEIAKALLAHCAKPLSSTQLDTFLSCKLKFFYKYICKFKEIEEVKEKENPAILGLLVHECMQNLYTKGLVINQDELRRKFRIQMNNFDEMLNKFKVYDIFPAESVLLLKHSFPYRMSKYIEKQVQQTKVLMMEEKLTASLSSVKLQGIIDRVDEREGKAGDKEILILDYKSFSLKNKASSPDFWEDTDLFASLHESKENFNEEQANILLSHLHKKLKSVQLPFYIYLLKENRLRPTNAAYVDLFDSCEEKKIISSENDERCIIEEQIPDILMFLTKYLQNISVFSKNTHTVCDWCSFKKYCS